MSKLIAIASLAAAFLLSALPARAEGDWMSKSFNSTPALRSDINSIERRAVRDATDDRKAKRHQVTKAEHKDKKHARKVVRAKTRDDGDDRKAKRQASTKSKSRERSSGGGQTGVASFYHEPQALASGGRFNPNALTAAHRTLPFGTRVRVTRVDNGNSVDVVINDRGPYAGGRIIDLSRRAAQEISMTGAGLARVRVAVLGRG